MCTVLLPPGDNPTAVNKYIISYIKYIPVSFFSQLYRASWYYQTILFTNWCTIELL